MTAVPRENEAMSASAEHQAPANPPSSRGTATAARIERSAVALVLEKGYDATTVDMICADAGVSQRTFFNHFPTKDAAIIGTDGPRLDEGLVRRFIVSNEPSILADAAALISLATIPGAADHDFMRQRLRAITSSAALMQRQLERFAAIEAELAEVIHYRLARVSGDDESDAELVEQSRLTAHLLAGVMRYTASALMTHDGSAPDRSVPELLEQTRRRLTALLPKLSGS